MTTQRTHDQAEAMLRARLTRERLAWQAAGVTGPNDAELDLIDAIYTACPDETALDVLTADVTAPSVVSLNADDIRRAANRAARTPRDRGPWQTDAACAGKWALFESTDPEQQDQALALCASCPVLRQCRANLDRLARYEGVVAGRVQTVQRAPRHRAA